LLECVFAVDAKPAECDFCAGASTERPHLSDLDVAANDFVAKPFDDDRDGCESGVSLAVSTTAGRRGQRGVAPPVALTPRRTSATSGWPLDPPSWPNRPSYRCCRWEECRRDSDDRARRWRADLIDRPARRRDR
jgi:hypothetical protein